MRANLKLLKSLCEASGAPGFEDEVRSLVLKELKGLCDEISIDRLGNVIAIKKANAGKKGARPLRVMLAGHMDEIGFVVKHIDHKGFLRLQPLGGFDAKTLIAKRVTVRTQKKDLIGVIGSKPIHVMSEEERKKLPKVSDLFVDVGMDEKTAKKLIDLGDPVTLRQDFVEFGDLVSCKALDNRVAVYTLLQSLRALKGKKHHLDVYAVFTTQEEVGVRGAIVSAFGCEPDVGVAVDVTLACDMPGSSDHDHITKLGEGTAIKICDGGSISNPRLVRFFRDLAKKKKVPYQLEILPAGGTDARGIQLSREGVPVTTLSIPTRYIHTVVESLHIKDLQATVDLLSHFLMEAHKADFSYC